MVNEANGREPSDAEKRAYIKNLEDPYAGISIFDDTGLQHRLLLNDNLESEGITPEWLQKVLSSYLPRVLRASDRKIVRNITFEFITRINALPSEQRRFVKRKLSSMKPEEGRQLEAARTTPDSIKIVLEQLLDQAKKPE